MEKSMNKKKKKKPSKKQLQELAKRSALDNYIKRTFPKSK